jgi:hypothetical protein
MIKRGFLTFLNYIALTLFVIGVICLIALFRYNEISFLIGFPLIIIAVLIAQYAEIKGWGTEELEK